MLVTLPNPAWKILTGHHSCQGRRSPVDRILDPATCGLHIIIYVTYLAVLTLLSSFQSRGGVGQSQEGSEGSNDAHFG